jgi:hypothetical protein
MKASCVAIYNFLAIRGTWTTSTEIVRACPTTTPSKRLSELHRAGYIEKKPYCGREMVYRVKEAV